MSHIVIVVQNLKIGGFQRIALDQCYAFAERNMPIELVSLEKIASNECNNFVCQEKDLIEEFKVNISYSAGTRLEQFKYFYRMLSQTVEPIQFLSHSLRATVLIRLAGLLQKNKFHINTTIHQIPSLSTPLQIRKRFFYALFSHKLFIFSAQAKLDWEAKISESLLLRILFSSKPITLLRNGVFLKRLPPILQPSQELKKSEVRLVFIGRPTSWKGVDTILHLADNKAMEEARFLFYFPYTNESIFVSIPDKVNDRITTQIGKSIRDYAPKVGDIHLYPANYGVRSSYIESISINCLEMIAMGVPSLVTKGGLSTWPEFANSSLVHEVDWTNQIETVKKILDIQKNSISYYQILKFRNLIDINQHIDQLLTSFKS